MFLDRNLTIAENIVNTILVCQEMGTYSVSLYDSIIITSEDRIIDLPKGVRISEFVNSEGRIYRAIYEYSDGSRIEYSYDNESGAKYCAIPIKSLTET